MKKTLQGLALRVPVIGSVVARRSLLPHRLRSLFAWATRPSAKARLARLRSDVARVLRIEPNFVARDRLGFAEAEASARSTASSVAAECARAHPSGSFHLRRFCLCCNETMPMLVDYAYCRTEEDGTRTPNWRERLVCRGCGMNNRQRLVAKLVQQSVARLDRPHIYLMEQVTPIFEWVRKLPGTEVHGSEYLGFDHKGGEQVNGVRHEDVMNLSYADESFDVVVSNDVLEHIPDPAKALAECFRVLKGGGVVIATFPFHVGNDATVGRAKLVGDRVEHLLPPQYHGNPVSSDGSLVFNDFGWDLLGVARGIGFSPAECESYASDDFGHFGDGLLVFRLGKP